MHNFLISNGKLQYIAGILGVLITVASGMHYGWPSPYLPVLQNGQYKFQLTSEEASYIVVVPLIFEIFGSLLNGITIDYIGRKNTIILSTIPFVVTWLLMGMASSSTLLFVSRFLVGLTDGLVYNALPMYLGEIADPKVRGFLASLTPLSVVFGVLLIYIIGAYLPLDKSAFILTSLPLFVMLTFCWMPETPYYHLMKGRQDKAQKSLQMFRGTDDVAEELKRISEAVKEQNENRGRLMDLFTVRGNIKALMICLGLRFFQQFIGAATIIFYSKTVFEEASSFIPSNSAMMIFGSIQFVLCTVSSFMSDIVGRRPLLITSLCGITLPHLCNGIFLYLRNFIEIDLEPYTFVPFVCVLIYTVFYSLGLHTVPVLVMSEVFPTNIKAFALCIMQIFFGGIVTLVSKYFHWTNETFGMHVPFLTFATFSVLGVVFVSFVVPETKGKTLEDIQAELSSIKKIPIDKPV